MIFDTNCKDTIARVLADTAIETLGYSKKNLLKNTATTRTNKGVTFTVNEDGSVTVNGTATALTYCNLTDADFTLQLSQGEYIFTCGNTTQNGVDLMLQTDSTTGTVYTASVAGCNILLDSVKTYKVFIRVTSGVVVDNLTFYPMIRDARIADDTYEPYVDDVNTRIEELKKSVSDGKTLVANAITEKLEVETATDASFETMANNILNSNLERLINIGSWNPNAGGFTYNVSAYPNLTANDVLMRVNQPLQMNAISNGYYTFFNVAISNGTLTITSSGKVSNSTIAIFIYV